MSDLAFISAYFIPLTPWLMNTFTVPQRSEQTYFSRLKARLIATIVPKHLRRAIFACSLAAKVVPAAPHALLAEAVCKDLDLVCTYNAMLAPMAWSDRIWQGLPDLNIGVQSRSSALLQAASMVVSSTPPSLCYASPRMMIEDTVHALRTAQRTMSAKQG